MLRWRNKVPIALSLPVFSMNPTCVSRALVWIGMVAVVACADAPTTVDNDPDCETFVSLRRGEVLTLRGSSSLECIEISSHSEASEYLLISANASSLTDDPQAYTVSAGVSSYFEDDIRSSERRVLGARSLGALANKRRSRELPPPGSAANAASAASVVGDTVSVRVANPFASNPCTAFTESRGVVKAVSAKAIVMLDVDAPNNGFTSADFSAIATEFDAVIFPTDAQWFGNPTDVDADGRITIYFTSAINRLTPIGSSAFVGGFFYFADLLPRSVPAESWSCPASNEREILYLLAPDPDGRINGNRHSVESTRESARGTMAHELQHMINQGVRQTNGVDQLESKWLNEGLSHFAEEVVGRAVRGYGDFRRLTWNDVLVDLDDYDSFFRQDLLRLRAWMNRPDLASPISDLAATQLAPRGASWALVRYAVDQYAGSNARGFTRLLVAGPETGVQNLEARTHRSFDEILPGFLVANFADSGAAGLPPLFGFRSWALRDAMANLNGGVFPLRVSPFPVSLETQSLAGSGNYFMLSRPAGSSAATFRMLSTTEGSAIFADARVYVVRLK